MACRAGGGSIDVSNPKLGSSAKARQGLYHPLQNAPVMTLQKPRSNWKQEAGSELIYNRVCGVVCGLNFMISFVCVSLWKKVLTKAKRYYSSNGTSQEHDLLRRKVFACKYMSTAVELLLYTTSLLPMQTNNSQFRRYKSNSSGKSILCRRAWHHSNSHWSQEVTTRHSLQLNY